jgi:hypothetical protein
VERGQEREIEGMNLIKIHYIHVLKYPSEMPLLIIHVNKNASFRGDMEGERGDDQL